jgi:uncharacterized protein YegL
MLRLRMPGSLSLGLLIVLLPVLAFADGVMIPRPIPGVLPHPDPFTVKYHHVEVSIENPAARTAIDQVFINNNDRDIEGTYIFPIPESASITEFVMWMNGDKITGELLPADEARRIYQDIVRQTKDPGLLEYAGRDAYRARVFPIPAHGEVRIELSYQELLTYDAGLVTYRYPLNTERFSAEPLENVSITVDIASTSPVKSLMSPSHDVDTSISGTTASCGYEDSNVLPDRDFFVYYTVSDRDLGLNLVTHKEARRDGYFMLLLSPGKLDDPDDVLAKDITFVFDRSGSMRGEKIEQAKRALLFALDHLNEGDRFNIITFATMVRGFDEGLVRVTASNIADARAFVEKIEAGGSTNIDSALRSAFAMPDSDAPQMIVFLTDGLPTAEITDIGTILENAEKRNVAGVRIFSFGVGYDVNTTLLDQLALTNRGMVDYVKPDEDIEQKVTSFYSKVASPVLSDIAIAFDDVTVYDVYPYDLPDVFNGTQAVVFGRYEGDGATAIHLTGSVRDRDDEFIYEGSFPSRESAHDFIPSLWATRKIAYLMTEIRIRGENPELKDEIVRLATEYGIVTPYTSYLVREELMTESPAWRDLDAPPGVSGLRDALAASPGASIQEGEIEIEATATRITSIKTETGKGAVNLSSRLAQERDDSVAGAPESQIVKRVGSRIFFYSSEHKGWVDSEYVEGADVTEVEYLSDAYFALLDQSPEIGKYLAIASNVTFFFEGTAYRVVS